MKYIISRASVKDGSKPIENCEKEVVREVEKTRFSVESYNSFLGRIYGDWEKVGYGHHINEKGEKVRYIDKNKWTIEINTLEQLNDFVENYGNVVVTFNKDDEPMIVIYDDYLDF